MKGVLIDPYDQTISEVEVEQGIEAIYQLIQAQPFCTVNLGSVAPGIWEALFIDDEGLYREYGPKRLNPETGEYERGPQKFFELKGYGQFLAGIGLILGCDSEGESVSTQLTSRVVAPKIRWVEDDEPKPEPRIEFVPLEP